MPHEYRYHLTVAERKIPILDIMGPVMVGPSSSHTAGTARLGRVARELLCEDPVRVEFYLHPPLAKTYRGHGSDFALVGGAIGMSCDDPRIPESLRIAEGREIEYEFTEEDQGDVHPNTVRIVARGPGRTVEVIGSSVGGGVIEVSSINGYAARYRGDSPTLMMWYRDRPGMIHEVTKIIADEVINIASLQCSRRQRGKGAFMQIDIDSPLSSAATDRIRRLADVDEVLYLDRIP